MGLYVMNADGTGIRQVGHTAGDVSAGWPVWSPDGTRIAFQRARGETGSHGYPLYSYAVVRLLDDKVVATGPTLSVDTLAAWSPDGKRILLLLTSSGTQRQLLLDPDGGPSTEVPWSAVGGDWERLAPQPAGALP